MDALTRDGSVPTPAGRRPRNLFVVVVIVVVLIVVFVFVPLFKPFSPVIVARVS